MNEYVYDLLPVPVLLVNAGEPFVVKSMNKACKSLWEPEYEPFIPQNFADLFFINGSVQHADATKCLKNASHDKHPCKIAGLLCILTGSGAQEKYLDFEFTPVFDSGAAVAQILVTLTDVTGEKATEQELTRSRDRYESLLRTVDGIVWEADAETLAFSYVSDKAISMLGYTPEEWLAMPNFWQDHIYYEDREHAVNFCHRETQASRNHTFDYRMIKADGTLIWLKDIVSVVSEQGKPRWLRGIMLDVTGTKLLSDLELLEKQALELSSQKNADIEIVLHIYIQGIERILPQTKCSLHIVRDGKLYNWSSPSLPGVYVRAINGLEIGPNNGSCGAAAFLNEMVIADDIERNEKWAAFKHLALPHGLLACWSYPITDSDGTVIAVFGIYYTTARAPDQSEIAIVERSASILKVILENRLYADRMREMNLMITQGQTLANFGNWQWDITNNKVSWSDVLYSIYGLDNTTFKATFEGYQALLHPDDRERVTGIITDALHQQNDFMFEERIIRPDGNIRYLRSWGRVIANEAGTPAKMIGACLDITEIKTTRTKMDEIAWLQSHVIRAPLARMLGLVQILRDELMPDETHHELLGHILDTSHELDKVIRNIYNKTKV